MRIVGATGKSGCKLATGRDAEEVCGASNVPRSFESKKYRCYWKGSTREGKEAAEEAVKEWNRGRIVSNYSSRCAEESEPAGSQTEPM